MIGRCMRLLLAVSFGVSLLALSGVASADPLAAKPKPPPRTATPRPTNTPVPTATSVPVRTPTATPVPPTATPGSTPQTPTQTPQSGGPSPTPTASPTMAVPTSTSVALPSSTPTPTTTATPTRTPRSTATPTLTPAPPAPPPPANGGGGGGGGGGRSSQQSAEQAAEGAGAAAATPPPAPKPPFVPLVPPTAQPAPDPSTAGISLSPPEFVLGFAFLKQQLGPTMGSPIEAEHGSVDSCDTQQRTSTGLAYWRCTTNTLSFAADPDGLVHWAWLDQLVTWRGENPDPQDDAVAVASFSTTLHSPADACVIAGTSQATACPLTDGMSLAGYIQSSGQSNAYRFDVAGPNMRVTADLTTLPADYDLYLVDAFGSSLGESVHEDVTPEQIDTLLGPGTYFLFVHSDPGRTFDGDNPYTVHLSVAPADGTTAAPLLVQSP